MSCVRVFVRRVVCAPSWERRVCVCADNSARGTAPFEGVLEVWREGSVELRYSAGSKEGARKGWRVVSERWVDLGSMVGRAGLKERNAALLFPRFLVDLESQAIVKSTKENVRVGTVCEFVKSVLICLGGGMLMPRL